MVRIEDVMKHHLVPRHEVLSDAEAHAVLKQYGISAEQLPKIYASDPAARAVGARPGKVLRILRDSPTAGHNGAVAYRLCIEG